MKVNMIAKTLAQSNDELWIAAACFKSKSGRELTIDSLKVLYLSSRSEDVEAVRDVSVTNDTIFRPLPRIESGKSAPG